MTINIIGICLEKEYKTRKGFYKMAKLKREKKPQKLKEKKPPKPKKQKTPKQKKEKKPKASKKKKGTNTDEDGGGKKSKKKILLIVLIMVLLTSAAIGFFIVKNKEKNIIIDNYTIGEDTVSSITTVVGERKLKETVVYELEGVTKQEYIYERDKNTEADLKAYETYLLDEADFTEMEVDKKDETQNASAIENLCYAVASVDEGFIFQMDIALLEDQYAITVSKQEGKDPKKEEVVEFTRDMALGSFEQFIDKANQLPKPIAEYTKIFDVGQSYINGETCYGITVYEKGNDEQNTFVEKYYISLETQNVYRYDNETRESTLVPKQEVPKPITEEIEKNEQTNEEKESVEDEKRLN